MRVNLKELENKLMNLLAELDLKEGKLQQELQAITLVTQTSGSDPAPDLPSTIQPEANPELTPAVPQSEPSVPLQTVQKTAPATASTSPPPAAPAPEASPLRFQEAAPPPEVTPSQETAPPPETAPAQEAVPPPEIAPAQEASAEPNAGTGDSLPVQGIDPEATITSVPGPGKEPPKLIPVPEPEAAPTPPSVPDQDSLPLNQQMTNATAEEAILAVLKSLDTRLKPAKIVDVLIAAGFSLPIDNPRDLVTSLLNDMVKDNKIKKLKTIRGTYYALL
ncbi:MAG: hypothetical protein V3R94_04970 [Acidobacteriota bacterium]